MSTESEEDFKREVEDNPDYYDQDDPYLNRHRGSKMNNSDDENHDHLDDQMQNQYHNHHKTTTTKVSINALLDQENIKTNRISTLMNAVSNQSLHNGLNYTDSPKKSKSTNVISTIKQNSSLQTATESLSLNKSTHNLLNQIKLHQTKQSMIKSASTNITNNGNGSNNSNDNYGKHKDDSEDNSLNIAVYKLLNQLEIKFPGKSSQQTKLLLNRLYTRLDIYKSKIANYWMVKLDDSKRAKVLYYTFIDQK
jgi:hypothetical protein